MRFKNKIATSSHIVSLYPVHKAVDLLAKTGYTAIEIWAAELEIQLKKHQTSIAKIKEALQRNDMQDVIHCPLKDLSRPELGKYNITSKNKKWRQRSLKENLLALEFAYKLGSHIVTIHPGHTDNPGEKADKEYWDLQIDAFQKLAKRAEKYCIKIGMEPMEHRPKEFIMEPPEVDKLLKAVRSKNLGLTFDLTHAYSHGKHAPIEFMDKLHRKKIFHVHMSGHSKRKAHVPFHMTNIPHDYLDKVLQKLVGFYKGIVSIEGGLKGIVRLTKENQKNIVQRNMRYIMRELKSLHLVE